MIKTFKLFKESAKHKNLQMDFKYIFMELIDDGYEMEIENKFFDKTGEYSSNVVNESNYRIGYIVKITKDIEKLDIEYVNKIVEIIAECNDRLSEYGDVKLDELRFSGYVIAEFYIIEKDSVAEVSNKEGFYNFIGLIESKFKRSYNSIKRSFDLENDNKENVIFKPKETGFNSKSLLHPVKSFINNTVFRKDKSRIYRPNGYSYEYDIQLVNNEIHVQYKGRTHQPGPNAGMFGENEDD